MPELGFAVREMKPQPRRILHRDCLAELERGICPAQLRFGRERLRVTWDRPTEPVTADEIDANMKLASGFTTLDATGEPWLLSKPLATAAGGYYHRGADLFGTEDVFMTKDDPGYKLLEKWISGETAQSTCAPTTMVGP